MTPTKTKTFVEYKLYQPISIYLLSSYGLFLDTSEPQISSGETQERYE